MAHPLSNVDPDVKPTTEQEFRGAIKAAELDHEAAKKKMAQAKKAWVNAESAVIAARVALDNLREEFRVWRKTTPNYQPSSREEEIEGFRERNPEVIEFARQRDEEEE